jgi:Anticodon binding domain
MTVHVMTCQVEELAAELRRAGVRVKTDTRDHQTPGWKYNFWELKVRAPAAGMSPSRLSGM